MRKTADKRGSQKRLGLDEKSARVLGKAFWSIANLYGFTREEQAILLGIKPYRDRIGRLEEEQKIPVDPDKFQRVGHLLGIHKSLRILFPHDKQLVYRWMSTPHELFNGKSPIQYVKEDPLVSLPRLFAVRRILDQVRCDQ